MEDNFKSGFVTMLGRTNVGKSSIINSLVGEKVAAIANKPQTTRTAIRAIVNRPNSQIIFLDTPGVHKPKSKLGNTMVETAFGALQDVDIVIFVIEATSTEIGKGDQLILNKIIESKKKTILVINKTDLVNKEHIAELISLYSKEYDFISVIPISVIKNKNLDILLDEIENNLNPRSSIL
jgi:GTP-binding protein Era